MNNISDSILNARYGEDPNALQQAQEQVEIAGAEFDVAQALYDLRHELGLTQKELARRVNTSPSVISRMEDADYDRHSLAMLRRIAAACGRRVKVTFEPLEAAADVEPYRLAG